MPKPTHLFTEPDAAPSFRRSVEPDPTILPGRDRARFYRRVRMAFTIVTIALLVGGGTALILAAAGFDTADEAIVMLIFALVGMASGAEV